MPIRGHNFSHGELPNSSHFRAWCHTSCLNVICTSTFLNEHENKKVCFFQIVFYSQRVLNGIPHPQWHAYDNHCIIIPYPTGKRPWEGLNNFCGVGQSWNWQTLHCDAILLGQKIQVGFTVLVVRPPLHRFYHGEKYSLESVH